MIITSIEPNKKKKDRLSVYIDGVYSFSLSEEAYFRLNLYDRKEITIEEIDYIKRNENFKSAKSAAVRYLSLKMHSGGEVYDKLDSEGFDKDIIDSVIDDLKAIGYINDKIYVQKYVFDRMKLKPKSRRLLKYELQNKGISSDIIDEIIDTWELDDSSIALSLIKKKFGKYDLHEENVMKKAYSFLHHRGYNLEVIQYVFDNLGKGSD